MTASERSAVLMSLPSSVLSVSAGRGSPTLSTPDALALGFFSPSASVSALRFATAGLAAGLGAAAGAAGLPALRALRRGASLILTKHRMDGGCKQSCIGIHPPVVLFPLHQESTFCAPVHEAGYP